MENKEIKEVQGNNENEQGNDFVGYVANAEVYKGVEGFNINLKALTGIVAGVVVVVAIIFVAVMANRGEEPVLHNVNAGVEVQDPIPEPEPPTPAVEVVGVVEDPEPDEPPVEEEPTEPEESTEPDEPIEPEPEPVQTSPPVPVVTTTTPVPAPVVTTTPAPTNPTQLDNGWSRYDFGIRSLDLPPGVTVIGVTPSNVANRQNLQLTSYDHWLPEMPANWVNHPNVVTVPNEHILLAFDVLTGTTRLVPADSFATYRESVLDVYYKEINAYERADAWNKQHQDLYGCHPDHSGNRQGYTCTCTIPAWVATPSVFMNNALAPWFYPILEQNGLSPGGHKYNAFVGNNWQPGDPQILVIGGQQ